MKIVIDFGHPAHVHYFKHFIKEMTDNGHEIMCFARERYPIQELLNAYGIEAINRGRGSNSLYGKALNFFRVNWLVYRLSKKFSPDVFVSFSWIYTTFPAILLGAMSICLTDTETASPLLYIFKPFVDLILTPEHFKLSLGKKHIRFPGTMDMAYLHPTRFSPDESVLEELGVTKGEKFAIVRFVSWNAIHDVGSKGLSIENKTRIVKDLSKYLKVIVSTEGEMPEQLVEYQYSVSPHVIHDVLFYAHLLFGESGTMSTEAAILGTSAVFVNNASLGCLEYFSRLGLISIYSDRKDDIEKAAIRAVEIAMNDSAKKENALIIKDNFMRMLDITGLLVWIIENCPQSLNEIKGALWDFDRFIF
ncbi:MAG: DUF354 domain-containing protein [Bacteroidales bacterium]|nr:DUF354 domain-containing protein [Bacteroidales bacterium]